MAEKKLSCEIVQDLLPSYCDGLTSEVTNRAVEEHLADCHYCRVKLESLKLELPLEVQEPPPAAAVQVVKKARRNTRRWAALITAGVLLLAALVLLSIPRVAEVKTTDYQTILGMVASSDTEVLRSRELGTPSMRDELIVEYGQWLEENQVSDSRRPWACEPGPVSVVKVNSLLGSCTWMILPVTDLCTWNVPLAGNVHWNLEHRFILVCDKPDSLVAKLSSFRVENLEAELDPGENTVVSSDVSTSLDGWYLDEIQESKQGKLISFPALKVKKFPQVETWYYAATKDSEQEHNVTASATGTWRYDLFLGHSLVASGEDSVSCEFITNFKPEN